MNILLIISKSCRENPIIALFIGFMLYFLSALTAVSLYSLLVGAGFGIAPGEMGALVKKLPDVSNSELMYFRLSQFGNQVLTWGLSGGIMAVVMGGFFKYLYLDRKPGISHLVLAIVVLLVSLPLVQALTFNAETFSLPAIFDGLEESARLMEIKNQGLMFALLKDPRIGILLLNILIVAVTPAVCEEMFFRGFLQRTIAKAWNIHIGIWLSAFIFSVIHFQFFGFFSRLFLGALLGYLVYGSGSLWPAILGHFVFNLMNILLVYGAFNHGWMDVSQLENTAVIPPYLIIISILAVLGLFFIYFRQAKHRTDSP